MGFHKAYKIRYIFRDTAKHRLKDTLKITSFVL